MLDLNLPKNSYVFLRKHLEEGVYQVSAVFASDVLKRNTDSLRCAVENDVFDSLPQDSLLNELEMSAYVRTKIMIKRTEKPTHKVKVSS